MNRSFYKLVVRGIKVRLKNTPCDYDAEAVYLAKKKINSLKLKYRTDEKSFFVYKKSVDARKKDNILFVYSVIFSLEERILLDDEKYTVFKSFCDRNGITVLADMDTEISFGTDIKKLRPVVAGFGPCGMFCALMLAKYGFRPIVIERGDDADTRTEKVSRYWNTGELDCESNVQFGEGGAGTFSDGKLMTRINDSLCSFVLETFYENGADEDILTNAKPHVGTDKLREIVKNIRKKIIAYGGEVHFSTKLSGLRFTSDGRLNSVITDKSGFSTDTLFLAVGHSARDTFRMLCENSVTIMPKPFSVGVRIEHLQSDIDRALYGEMWENPALPKGEYSLSRRYGDRAVYSFCMCPGGTVVASASEKDSIVTNGMSYSTRDGINANSAIAVSINTDDFGNDVFSAIEFQHRLEADAFILAGGNGAAPIQSLGNFLGETTRNEITKVIPTYTGKTELCDLNRLFPAYVSKNLALGLRDFEKQIEGFSSHSAVLTAPETRTSSPVRIPRIGDVFCSVSSRGIYPCGEGAGYAGGITSAAVDGIRCAMAYISRYKPKD